MQKNILIFPAGTEIAFEIQNSLKYSKFVRLFGGSSTSDHADFTYERLIGGFPYVNDDGFLDYLNKVIDEYDIDCVYPAHDSVCLFFSEHAEEIHAQVIITDEHTTKICRSKQRTYEYFDGEVFIPRTYDTPDDIDEYPVFIKPAVGQGSVGVKKINNREELERILAAQDSKVDRQKCNDAQDSRVNKLNGIDVKNDFRSKGENHTQNISPGKNREIHIVDEKFVDNSDGKMVICEYLPGDEYTVDCFTDLDGKLLFCRQRSRDRIKTGISVRSRSMSTDDYVMMIAEKLNEKLSFKGAWFFQVKKKVDGEYRLMEVSPRIPGTAGLYRNCGINFPMLTLFTFWGYPVSIIDNDYDIVLDRAFYSAFRIGIEYDTVYLDYDDTLTLEDKVNADAMRFLYQARNAGKRIILLSKHSTDLHVDLKNAGISEELFDEIIVLSREEDKSDHIIDKKAIFIDDSFAERKRIKEKCGIPVFDVDMIESLIDWRM
ncbi:ATP-grasp domain-containing protein [Butyrivibrio sp. WCE2006]|uniref:ATP-grasp domain-containing protein n=1 Tax=Butyrivibrio sp. WCE2006 TaxID=1410611 RepID=UPI0006796A58|nr:ATP-grasp domain-containing protein [Butyrivibrio sp. WCE2006]